MSTETGIEELRHAASTSRMCQESTFDGYTAEECLNTIRACWGSEWDILPDNLTREERNYAALHGGLTIECRARLTRELGGPVTERR